MAAFDSFAAFLAMGDHGLYVWTSYGVAVGVVLYNQLSPRLLRRRLVTEHQRRRRRERS